MISRLNRLRCAEMSRTDIKQKGWESIQPGSLTVIIVQFAQ